MQTVAWMVGREGGVTELLFDAPQPPFQISKELVFRDDAAVAETTLAISHAAWKFEKERADQLAQAFNASLTRKLELLGEIEQLKAQLLDTQSKLIARNAEYSHALTREFQRGQEIEQLKADVGRQMAVANAECQYAATAERKVKRYQALYGVLA